MNFDLKAIDNKSTRDRTLIKLRNSPSLMVSAFGISKTRFLSSDPNEICSRLKLLFQEKHGGYNSNTFDEEFVVIVDKLLEEKCISKKQHKQLFINCNLLHE